MKNKKLFLGIIAAYFGVSGVLHFLRLAFEWDIFIGERYVNSMISALCILFAAFIIFWTYKIKQEDKKKVRVEVVEDNRKLED